MIPAGSYKMPREDEQLIMKSAELAQAAPHEWSRFMDALSAFAGIRARQCVQAPPERLQTNQGRAQQAAELESLFRDAVKTADRITTQAAHKQ